MTGPTATCSRCGTPVSPGARACSNCGADVSGQQGQVATAYSGPADSSRVGVTQGTLVEALKRATIGEYEIKGELGQGGMASVYLAHDIALDRKVAIKVMAPALFSTAGMVERFKREARTAASLSHPHIIPIYAVRESPEIVYFVMKFVEGRSLESIAHQLGQMPIPLVQTILYQVSSALGYAHRRGVVHRDIKPANIMIDADGWAVVTDFGIAKVAESQGLTQTGATIGTPSYMSPEQCSAKSDLTGASDQYSLGIVAYEMLGGHVPFRAETTMGLLFAHVHETPPPITDLRPDCPPEVGDTVMRMLEKEPGDRWPDIETAAGELGGLPIRRDDPIRAQLVELAGGRTARPAETIRTPMSPLPANRAAPPPATRTTTPKDRRPATRTGTPAAATATATPAVKPGRSPLLWIIPMVAVAGAVAWLVLGRGPKTDTALVTPPTSAAPIETLRVVERSPAETVRLNGGTTTSNPQPRPTPETRSTPPTTSRPGSSGKTGYSIEAARAIARRVHASSAGATAQELSAGDADAAAAEALARDGNYTEASARLASAIERWNSAEIAAQGRPRRTGGSGGGGGGGGGQGIRGEAEQVAAEFADAFSAKSMSRLRTVFPRMSDEQAQQFGQQFLGIRDVSMQLHASDVTRLGPLEAQATFSGSYDYTEMQGGAAGNRQVNWQVTLRQSAMGWRIIAMR